MSTSITSIGQEGDPSALRLALLQIHEQILTAQLLAVRKLLSMPDQAAPPTPSVAGERRKRKGRSHLDMAYDILKSAGSPLHASEIISRISATFGASVDSESLVSALSKRVARKDRFARTARNTFALL